MLGLLLVSVLAAGAVDVEVQKLDGSKITGQLTEWHTEGVTLKTAAGEVKSTREELLSARPINLPEQSAQSAPAVWVELADGSILPGGEFSVAASTATLTLNNKPVLALPTRDLKTVRLKEQTEDLAEQWQRICQLKPAGDLLVIRKKEALDYLEGELGAVTADKVMFMLEGDEISVPREKVEGLVYYAARARKFPDSVCSIIGLDGTKVRAQSVELKSGKLRATTLLGPIVEIPIEGVSMVDYSEGKILYLSDLKPDTSDWKPYFGLPKVDSVAQFGGPRRDQSQEGGPLSLQQVDYVKGLALRSRSELTYRIPDGFQRFLAIAGIDDRMRGAGNVRLVISGDDKRLHDAVIAGGDAPKKINLDISGVRRLTILVDYGDDFDVSDHLDLCDARISK